MGSSVGVLYGTASSTRFDLAVTEPRLRRLDYVIVRHEGHDVLCQVDEVVRRVCHEDAPACIRCPLASSCQHHQQLRTERKKTRAGIRRLWTR